MKLLDNVTTTGAGTAIKCRSDHPQLTYLTFQGVGTTSSGSGTATILVQVSNDNTNWMTLGSIALTLGTSATTDGFASNAAWTYVRGNVSGISGTGATVSLIMGS